MKDQSSELMAGLRARLHALGFAVIDGASAKAFGDSIEVWQRGSIQVRVVSDRGIITVELRESASDQWVRLGLVLNQITPGGLAKSGIVELSTALEMWRQVEQVMLDPTLRQALVTIQQNEIQEWVDRTFGQR